MKQIFARWLTVLCLASLAVAPAPAQEEHGAGTKPTTVNQSPLPLLRVETGTHTAIIGRIATDSANRFAVTASDDGTARVWELPSGRLLRVLRPPLGTEQTGQLFAVALSPDGSTVVTGGQADCLYVFDRNSGLLRQRLPGLTAAAQHIVYARDGKLLAVVTKGSLRLYDMASERLTRENKDCASESFGVAFDSRNRLATTCTDGLVRLYGADGARLAERATTSGKRPYAISFSPDGARLAVGLSDAKSVEVFNGADLEPLFNPDTSGVLAGNLSKVTWSADGRYLYAAGRHEQNRQFVLRRWAEAGRGAYRDIPLATNTITHLEPLANNGLLFSAADPAFGIVSAEGQRALFITSPVADLRGSRDDFRIADDGLTVQFSFTDDGQNLANFSLPDRLLKPGDAADPSLRPPLTVVPGVAVTDWLNNLEPKLNGQKLDLEIGERSRSLALSADAGAILLGTETRLRLYSRNGQPRWSAPLPGIAWKVNLSRDGRFALAACGDGTIRWYRVADGQLLLTLLPHADRRRWVVSTPAGYYDAAPAAEDLLGWHVNNGTTQAADFFPVSRFRAAAYRPEKISQALGLALSANPDAPASVIAGNLPPIVEIVAPTDGAGNSGSSVILRYRVRTPSGAPLTNITALVDGLRIASTRGVGVRPAAATTPLCQPGSLCELAITVPARDCAVSLIATDRNAASVPITIQLRWRGLAQTPVFDEFVIKPKLYLVAVGVSKYANAEMSLAFPAKDAKDFATAIERQKGQLYRDVTVKILTDEQATSTALRDALQWLEEQTTAKDVAMLFLAGHGVNDTSGQYYYLSHDANLEKLRSTTLPFTEIKRTVETLAGKTLFFVDTCHSGNVLGTARRRGVAEINGVVNELTSAENGAVVFAAATGNQASLESVKWNNGAFTKALVEALSGKADYSGKGRITVNMLDLYLSERVKELTNGKQTPTTVKPQTMPDFPVAIKYE